MAQTPVYSTATPTVTVAFAQERQQAAAAFLSTRSGASGRLFTGTEAALAAALEPRGVVCDAVVWDDPTVEWSRFAAVLPLSAWDYTDRLDEFLAWLAAISRVTRVLNSPALVAWNARKNEYLPALAARDVRLPRTAWVAPAAVRAAPACDALAAALAAAGMSDVPELVLKPAVSAGAHNTIRVSAASLGKPEVVATAERIAHEGKVLMLQEFVREVCEAGELSLVFVQGRFAHAITKQPAEGDFRVQQSFGGTNTRAEPAPAVLAAAERVLAAAVSVAECGSWPTYARVDGIVVDGEFVLIELELIEPYLWLESFPDSARALAAAIADVALAQQH